MSTADAVTREAAWLNTTGDSLPALIATAGGPWQVVQAYWPGAHFASQRTGIYVQRSDLDDVRAANIRIRPQYAFELKLVWPVRATTTGIAETEAQNLDNAVELLIQRLRGPVGDKSHGGRFLSVCEVPRENPLTVRFDDPETTIPQQKALRATVLYHADDLELNE